MKLDINKNYIIQGNNLEWLNWIPNNSIDLCYIDPPFFTNKDYGEFKDKFKDIKDYIFWMRSRIELIHKKLKQTGSIFLHCDWHASHRLRCLLDYVFGTKNFVNEIIWSYQRWTASSKSFQKTHDSILFYCRSNFRYYFKPQMESYSDKSAHKAKRHTIVKAGKLSQNYTKNIVREKLMRDVWELSILNSQAKERIGYPTQKPESLIKRIVECASNPGDMVLDCFVGCGTTAKVCGDLNRKFIVGDVSSKAIEITNKRLDEKCNDVQYEIKNLSKFNT